MEYKKIYGAIGKPATLQKLAKKDPEMYGNAILNAIDEGQYKKASTLLSQEVTAHKATFESIMAELHSSTKEIAKIAMTMRDLPILGMLDYMASRYLIEKTPKELIKLASQAFVKMTDEEKQECKESMNHDDAKRLIDYCEGSIPNRIEFLQPFIESGALNLATILTLTESEGGEFDKIIDNLKTDTDQIDFGDTNDQGQTALQVAVSRGESYTSALLVYDMCNNGYVDHITDKDIKQVKTMLEKEDDYAEIQDIDKAIEKAKTSAPEETGRSGMSR